MHPPTASGDSEPPRESQKRAIATLNDSGSERRPPDWERESGTGAARGPRRRDLAGVARGRAGSAARGPTGAPGRRAGSAPAARGSAAGAERQSGREGSLLLVRAGATRCSSGGAAAPGPLWDTARPTRAATP